MALRPIKPEEQSLIAHLLSLVNEGSRYAIPQEVQNMGNAGTGSIQLSSRGDYAANLVEGDYKDADGRDVLITLSTNEYDELYDLDIWKADFSRLAQFPEPEKVKLSR